jgi:hypothetical protein
LWPTCWIERLERREKVALHRFVATDKAGQLSNGNVTAVVYGTVIQYTERN